MGGIPVFNASNEPVLAQQMIEKRLRNIEAEADFFSSIILDDQHAVAESWCRVQSVSFVDISISSGSPFG